MASTAFPEILYKDEFWPVVWIVLIAAIFLAGRKRRPPFPRVADFFADHKKTITRVTDVGAVLLVALMFLFPLSAVKEVISALSQPEPPQELCLAAWRLLFTSLTVWTGIASFFIGLLSPFRSNLTKSKRGFLVVLCLLPIALTVLRVLALVRADESPWSAVYIYLGSSLLGLILNAPAIFAGKDFDRFVRDIVRKIRRAPAEQQE